MPLFGKKKEPDFHKYDFCQFDLRLRYGHTVKEAIKELRSLGFSKKGLSICGAEERLAAKCDVWAISTLELYHMIGMLSQKESYPLDVNLDSSSISNHNFCSNGNLNLFLMLDKHRKYMLELKKHTESGKQPLHDNF